MNASVLSTRLKRPTEHSSNCGQTLHETLMRSDPTFERERLGMMTPISIEENWLIMGCLPSTKKQERRKLQLLSVRQVQVRPGLFAVSNNQQVQDTYKIGRLLWSAPKCEVRLVTHKQSGTQRALKIFRKDEISSLASVHAEIKLLRSLDHPNIIKVHEFFEDERRFFVVTECCQGGELLDELLYRGHLSESCTAQVIWQICSALNYLHSRGLTQTSLALHTVLLVNPGDVSFVKLVNFDPAAQPLEQERKLISLQYFAPEVVAGFSTLQADLWRCGLIAYALLSGTFPFTAPTRSTLLSQISQCMYSLEGPAWYEISPGAKQFVQSLLCPALDRMSAAQALSDPWLVQQTPSLVTEDEISDALEKFATFKTGNKFVAAIRMYLATQCLSTATMKQGAKLFGAIDRNHNGTLELEEVQAATGVSDAVTEAFRAADSDNSGCLEFSEFITATVAREVTYSPEQLQTAFAMFDRDGSGKISVEEVHDVLVGDKQIDSKMWDNLVRIADTNGDGEIDFEEFRTFVSQTSIVYSC